MEPLFWKVSARPAERETLGNAPSEGAQSASMRFSCGRDGRFIVVPHKSLEPLMRSYLAPSGNNLFSDIHL
jgi:hypothetical protein